MKDGFIMLSRKFFSTEMWEAARTFSECEAWLDLIQSARFDATRLTVGIGGRDITYGRGQFPASIRFLSKRWSWGERKVREFLERLRKKGMITTDNSQGVNVITLTKYDEYNSPNDTANDTANDTDNNLDYNMIQAFVTQAVTQLMTHPPEERHSNDTKNNKDKKDIYKETTTKVVAKKGEKTIAALAATNERKQEFYDSLVPFVDKYGKEMIRDFFNYWSEMNKSKTKMRFEGEKTWETNLRLATWERRSKNEKTDTRTIEPTGYGEL